MSPDANLTASLASRWRVRVVLALVCLVALAGVWAVAGFADRRERENHIDDLAARVRTSANAYALAIGARLRMIDQMLLYAAADYERDPERFNLAFWLEQLPSIRAISPEFSFADKNGIARQSSVGPSAIGVDITDREYFLVHRFVDIRQLHVGQIVTGRTTERRSIQLSRRVNDRAGNFAGVLVFSVDPDFLLDVIDRMKVGIEGGGAVRREGGAAIVRVTRAGREVGHGNSKASTERFESADSAIMGYLYNAEVVRASRGIDEYDLVVDAEGNVAEALAEIQQRRQLIWLAAAVLTLAILGLFAALIFDLTRLGRLRAELERRNRQLSEANIAAHAAVEAKSRFLANMSHEFRTPLNAIIGFAEALKSGLFGTLNARQTEYAGHIHSSGGHLLALINDVLDISRLDLDAYVLHPERLDLGAAIAGSVRTLSVAAEQKGVDVAADVPAGLPTIVADERALKQVLLNLLSNAVKFTPRGGTVSIAAAARRDGAVALTVSDTGVGIAPADLARLFQPFQQADNTRRHNTEGTGLGLVISRRLMEKHGGTLHLESELGKGTRAVAVFPAERVAAPAAGASAVGVERAAALAA
ncbi:MAG TPA: ATP-binding protein [Alphaproteobacteria bacterium]|jgi:signal transduction histidine kinase